MALNSLLCADVPLSNCSLTVILVFTTFRNHVLQLVITCGLTVDAGSEGSVSHSFSVVMLLYYVICLSLTVGVFSL